jgi:hypothetical protein
MVKENPNLDNQKNSRTLTLNLSKLGRGLGAVLAAAVFTTGGIFVGLNLGGNSTTGVLPVAKGGTGISTFAIADNLSTTAAGSVLSAKQGKALNDDKQAKLDAGQLNAVNSGITANKVAAYDTVPRRVQEVTNPDSMFYGSYIEVKGTQARIHVVGANMTAKSSGDTNVFSIESAYQPQAFSDSRDIRVPATKDGIATTIQFYWYNQTFFKSPVQDSAIWKFSYDICYTIGQPIT